MDLVGRLRVVAGLNLWPTYLTWATLTCCVLMLQPVPASANEHDKVPPDDAPQTFDAVAEPHTSANPAPRRNATTAPTLQGALIPRWVAQGPGPTISGQVENVAPQDEVVGAIHDVAPHPTNPDIVFVAGVNSGIWRTFNARATSPNWTPLIDDLPSLSITALEFDPTDPNFLTLVAGYGRLSSFGGAGGQRNGLLRTTDGGNTWDQLADPQLVNQTIVGLVARGDTIVAAAGFTNPGGVYRSTDGGASFSLVMNGPAFDVVADPTTLSRIYVAMDDDGIYRSDDTGETWSNISDSNPLLAGFIGSSQNANTEMAVAPNGRLYVAVLLSGPGGTQPRFIGYTDDPEASSPTWVSMDIPTTPTSTPLTVSDATNTVPITITAVGHAQQTGQFVEIRGVQGNTAANGVFPIQLVDVNRFQLIGSGGNGDYTGGGLWTPVTGINPRKTSLVVRARFTFPSPPTTPGFTSEAIGRTVRSPTF